MEFRRELGIMETESFRIRLESMSVDPRGGHLQKYLYNGEYDHFRHIPIFESDFIQVSKKGGILDIHKKVTLVTIGVMATSPALMLPNIMLLAKHVWQATLEHCACMPGCRLCGGTAPRTRSKEHGVQMELTRLFPLKFVKLTIHDSNKYQIKMRLANGCRYYLQLYAPSDREKVLFEKWKFLISILLPHPQGQGRGYSSSW
ncbi:Golgi-associated RAB2 interactor protein 6 isoform X3 [Latimeria chalumnae]|uniref:Golgi-associated RAB2 interactor protein 6 isoform X3 n=1 Tax=Latimeria chalumnae TaxID=7897 RepID=UPI00313C0041